MKYAVIGDPVSHSLSPVMHQVNFKSLNMEDTYEALHIPHKISMILDTLLKITILTDSMLRFRIRKELFLIWMKLMTKQKSLEPLIL